CSKVSSISRWSLRGTSGRVLSRTTDAASAPSYEPTARARSKSDSSQRRQNVSNIGSAGLRNAPHFAQSVSKPVKNRASFQHFAHAGPFEISSTLSPQTAQGSG